MKIAMAHFRVGETDGVSLEMDKWREVLERMGHTVYYISGSKKGEIYIPELYYRHLENEKFVANGYQALKDYTNESTFYQEMLNFSKKIENKLEVALREYGIELLIPNNIWSLGWNLPAAIAFQRITDKLNLPSIAHHHDFYWERELYSHPTCSYVTEILNKYFPPESELVNHVVINQLAKEELEKRRSIESVVVPNIFDFNQPDWIEDDYNRDFREKIGCSSSDIIILQATRVAERKAIELAVEMVGCLVKRRSEIHGRLYDGRYFSENDKIVLLMPGLVEAGQPYIDFLQNLADKNHVEIIWINDRIKADRKIIKGEKYYSLWDTYAIADVITYPSIKEGWGNQFLEGLFARKPMAVFEYPVFKKDIKDKGFMYASFGDEYRLRDNGYVAVETERIEKVATEVIRYLKDKEYRGKVVNNNYYLGKKNYSLDILQFLLEELLEKAKSGFNLNQ